MPIHTHTVLSYEITYASFYPTWWETLPTIDTLAELPCVVCAIKKQPRHQHRHRELPRHGGKISHTHRTTGWQSIANTVAKHSRHPSPPHRNVTQHCAEDGLRRNADSRLDLTDLTKSPNPHLTRANLTKSNVTCVRISHSFAYRDGTYSVWSWESHFSTGAWNTLPCLGASTHTRSTYHDAPAPLLSWARVIVTSSPTCTSGGCVC